MDHRDDAGAEKLDNLTLARATFALQLDAFEARMRRRSSAAGAMSKLDPIEITSAKSIVSAMKCLPSREQAGNSRS
jgi:hypothetical protein